MDAKQGICVLYAVVQKAKYRILALGRCAAPERALEIARVLEEHSAEIYRLACRRSIRLPLGFAAMGDLADMAYADDVDDGPRRAAEEMERLLDHIALHLKEKIRLARTEENYPLAVLLERMMVDIEMLGMPKEAPYPWDMARDASGRAEDGDEHPREERMV